MSQTFFIAQLQYLTFKQHLLIAAQQKKSQNEMQ